MTPKEQVLDDPRLVVAEIAGRKYEFWLNRRGYRIAKHQHGYDIEAKNDGEDEVDSVFRLLWVAHLPFSPDLTFEDFEMRFLPHDYADLLAVMQRINEQQAGPKKEGDPAPKKTKRAA